MAQKLPGQWGRVYPYAPGASGLPRAWGRPYPIAWPGVAGGVIPAAIAYLYVFDGSAVLSLPIAALADPLLLTTALRVSLGGGNVGAADLVDTGEPDASPVRVSLGAQTLAWRRG